MGWTLSQRYYRVWPDSGWTAQAQSMGTFRYARQRVGVGRGLLDGKRIGDPDRRIRILSPWNLYDARHSRRRLAHWYQSAKGGNAGASGAGGFRKPRRLSCCCVAPRVTDYLLRRVLRLTASRST